MSCPDDTEIVAFAQGLVDDARREAVLSHIETCPECAGLAAEAARDDMVQTAHVDAPVSAAENPVLSRGSSVGRYLLLDPIGSGALGQVFTAYDPELDRRVAIKLLLPSVMLHQDGEAFRSRLAREAQALARVKHPNVVAVHDVGNVGQQMFIAMELVEGQTLGVWLTEHNPPWTEIRDVFVAAGEGLLAAHRAGLVHRDFKPTNVLIDASGRPQVADFGLARAVGSAPRPSAPVDDTTSSRPLEASMTASGAIVGTPAYMSPEQHRGRAVDARADQFAFCVALFEALYGVRPFAGSSLKEILGAVESGRVTSASNRLVPSWLKRAVLTGLHAHPSERFDSMAELLEALQQDRATKKRRRVVVGLAALAVAGAAWGTSAWLSANEVPSMAEVDALTVEARAAAAKLRWVYPPSDEPDAATAYVKVLELEGVEGAAEEAADRRGAELRDEFAQTLVGLGDEFWERPGGAMFATDYYAAALVFDADHPRAAQRAQLTPAGLDLMRRKAAQGEFTVGELAAAEPLTALALDDDAARRRAVAALYDRPPRPPSTTTAAISQLLGPNATGDNDEPTPVVAAADDTEIPEHGAGRRRATRRSRPGPRAATSDPRPQPAASGAPADPEASMAEAKLGLEALAKGRISEAETHFHAAVGLHRRNHVALAGLGEVAFQREAFDRAARFFERAVAVKPGKAKYRIDLGDVYLRVLRYDDARVQYRKAIDLGSASAKKRLARLENKIGADP